MVGILLVLLKIPDSVSGSLYRLVMVSIQNHTFKPILKESVFSYSFCGWGGYPEAPLNEDRTLDNLLLTYS